MPSIDTPVALRQDDFGCNRVTLLARLLAGTSCKQNLIGSALERPTAKSPDDQARPVSRSVTERMPAGDR
jgi:hypothetical protein